MKRILVRFLTVLCLSFCVGVPRTKAQVAPVLDIQLYAGLTITGAVGTVYSVECVSDLAQTNTPGAWRCLEYLQLPASPYLWTDKSAPATAMRFYRAVAMRAPTNMVFIPPGTFWIGSPTNEVDRRPNEGPQTEVTISRGFWIGTYEVTQGEYLGVMGNNPSKFQPPYASADLSRPVETVTWNDAVAYCSALTLQELAAGRIPTNCTYRLPTEAQWEYACRGWTSTRFSYGEDPGYMAISNQMSVAIGYTNLTDNAWYEANSSGETHSVGKKLPNLRGLYDMHGNVWEWCQDWLDGGVGYPGGVALDPQGAAAGSMRVIRGGSYGEYAWNCRAAHRNNFFPQNRNSAIGFRVVLVPGQP